MDQSPPPEARASAEPTITFLAFLRGIAALLVVYCHLVGGPVEAKKLNWLPYSFVRDYVLDPLYIAKNFGYFGVILFFLISGFIMMHVLQREDHLSFAVKRALRIYPPLIVAVLLTVWLYQLQAHVDGVGNEISRLTMRDVLLTMTLANVYVPGVTSVLGVSWTLTIEMLFYLLCLAMLPLVRRWPWATVGGFLAVTLVSVGWVRQHPGNYSIGTFGSTIIYVPFFVLGMILYFNWAKRLSTNQSLLALAVTWVVLVYGVRAIQPFALTPEYAIPSSVGIAFGMFAVFMANSERIRMPRAFTFAADVSYSMYLYHLPVGVLVISALLPKTGFTIAFFVAFVVVMLFSWLSYRFVEQPAQGAARSFLRRIRDARRARASKGLDPATIIAP